MIYLKMKKASINDYVLTDKTSATVKNKVVTKKKTTQNWQERPNKKKGGKCKIEKQWGIMDEVEVEFVVAVQQQLPNQFHFIDIIPTSAIFFKYYPMEICFSLFQSFSIFKVFAK